MTKCFGLQRLATFAPCCGTEFEVDDDELSHAELRTMWVEIGSPWFSRASPQLNKLDGLIYP